MLAGEYSAEDDEENIGPCSFMPSEVAGPTTPQLALHAHSLTLAFSLSLSWSQVCTDTAEFIEDQYQLSPGEGCYSLYGSCGCLVLLLAIILLASSLTTIDSTEQALAYNTPQAILGNSVVTEGLHGKPPFGEFIIWPKTTQMAHFKLSCLSSDGVVVSTQLAYQYTVITTRIHELTLNYQDFSGWQAVVVLKTHSGIRNACARFKAQVPLTPTPPHCIAR